MLSVSREIATPGLHFPGREEALALSFWVLFDRGCFITGTGDINFNGGRGV